jgi:ribosome-associated protein
VKKKQSASKSTGKGQKQSAGPRAPKRKAKPTPKATTSARKSGSRLPVRGARGSSGARGGGGVKPRVALPEAPPRRGASAADVAETRELAVAAMQAAIDKKALLPVLIDVSAMASYTDFIGLVSGRSDRQVDAIADGIMQTMKARGRYLLGQEGTGSGRWTLLDFGAFVIHVFHHPVREFYDLESLWIDAPRVKLDVPPESELAIPDALYGAL